MNYDSHRLHQSPLFAERQLIDFAGLGRTELNGQRLAIIEDFQHLNRLGRAARMLSFSIQWGWIQRQLHRRHGLKVTGRAVAIPDLESPTFLVELNSHTLLYYTNRLCQQDDRWATRTIKRIIQGFSRIPMEAGAVIIFAEKNGCD